MLSLAITLNDGKPAAGTSCDGLDLMLWTATPSEGQDDDDIHIRRNQA